MQHPPSMGASENNQEENHRWGVPLPEAREVVSGIWKISLPIPFPLRAVNVYALIGPSGWALIDAGMGTPDGRAAFATGLRKAGLEVSALEAIVLTHHHPDHIGLSGELQEQSGAAVYMHPIDEDVMQLTWSGALPRRFGRVSRFFGQHGLPSTELWTQRVEPEVMRSIVNVPPHAAMTLVEDGQKITLAGEDYRIFWVPGHSDGQICLFRERDGVFVAADHVLPRITPNIGLYSEKERPNPLNDYLESLGKVRSLPASIVLPGHGEPFRDLAGRADEIVAHHEARLQQLLQMLAEGPQHAYALTGRMFGSRLKNDEAKRMAMAEVLSHLEYLRYQGQVEQRATGDGLIHYAIV
ncbi:MAG TPA: MBL fold metallo-hydrolase [Ktedonobacteraceae bacterium]|nr:MBL fold metallo-hydrolase [Ktedonobacteraceae bacterium]